MDNLDFKQALETSFVLLVSTTLAKQELRKFSISVDNH